MPTTDNSTTAPRAGRPAASKRAATTARTPNGRRTGSAARSNGASRTRAGSPKATAKASSARRSTGPARPAARSTTVLVGDYAERAILIPVGAALIARDLVVSSVNDAISSYSTPSKAQTQLRKFERRGTTARNRLEREVRKTRTRLERELRQRRRELDRRRGSVTKSLSGQVEQTQSQLEKTQAQIESAVRARLEDGADFASRIQDRVLNLV
jgi:hypothetical protein